MADTKLTCPIYLERMMSSYPQAPSPLHLYSQALQLKLYQAFIFSIPILFSIILFLLFYLFYLKRRTNNSILSSSPLTLPSTNVPRAPASTLNQVGLKGNQMDKLPMVLFDEELRTKDSQCCVCLGEFELTEELNQIPSCSHMFHVDCIRHWLHSNSTCPLCRCSVVASSSTAVIRQGSESHGQQMGSVQQQEQVALAVLNSTINIASLLREECMVVMGSSSGTSICIR